MAKTLPGKLRDLLTRPRARTLVTGIERFSLSGFPGAAFFLDEPRPGAKFSTYSVTLCGWVIGAQERIDQIQIGIAGQVLDVAEVNVCRPDVLSKFPDNSQGERCGFSIDISTALHPTETCLSLAAISRKNARGLLPLAALRLRHEPLLEQLESSIAPILVFGCGRTGSTWLLRLLSQHEAIVTDDEYPYEARPAQYQLHALSIQTTPGRPHHGVSRFPQRTLGPNPDYGATRGVSSTWLGAEHVELQARHCVASIRAYYDHQAGAQNKAGPRYFIEKAVASELEQHGFAQLFQNPRSILLVRDPRDVLCSVMAFNAKRGYREFGWQPDQSVDDYARWLAGKLESQAAWWRRGGDAAHLIRYEDLVTQPAESLLATLVYLGLANDELTINELLRRAGIGMQELRFHRTSGSGAESIGRWRRELDPELAALCNDLFAQYLASFGYV